MNVLITGGTGFIGCNVALYYGRRGHRVTVLDNLERPGSTHNLEYLVRHVPGLRFVHADVRCRDEIDSIIKSGRFHAVLHLAGQVAVTSSVADPRKDFEINALGSLNVLEAIRRFSPHTVVVYSSTNKVYGAMEDVPIVERATRYEYRDLHEGVDENRPLDFHSPYGCSKGAADQYFRDYHRIYGLSTIVFRQSCIYGYRQFGIEDQGWVAWFTIASTLGAPLSIYGDGKQVRDVLFITDLVRAYDLAIRAARTTAGQVYNIGGGKFQMSLLELLQYFQNNGAKRVRVRFEDWRPGDQRVYVSNIGKAWRDFGWAPQVKVEEGLKRLVRWVKQNRAIFKTLGLIK